jgi:hypothetical protein
VTEFFLAGSGPGGDVAEAAYKELRERSHIAVGCAATPRRIFKLDCRFEGCDCEIEVGRSLPHGGNVVTAILDHGRDESFIVHTLDSAPPTRVSRPVYTVTDFS